MTTDEDLSYRISRKVIYYKMFPYTNGEFTAYALCPRCNTYIEYDYQSYCGNCGQKLDWEYYDHAIELPLGLEMS